MSHAAHTANHLSPITNQSISAWSFAGSPHAAAADGGHVSRQPHLPLSSSAPINGQTHSWTSACGAHALGFGTQGAPRLRAGACVAHGLGFEIGGKPW